MADTWKYSATTNEGRTVEGASFRSRKELIDHLVAQEPVEEEGDNPLESAKRRAEESGVAGAARKGFASK